MISQTSGIELRDGWQPIETAPLDGTIVLIYRRGCATAELARFDDQRHYTKPLPYWTSLTASSSVLRDRKNPPLVWQPLPKPPEELRKKPEPVVEGGAE